MFGFLTSARPETAGPLTDADAAEAFWRTLPHDDPIAAQVAVVRDAGRPHDPGRPQPRPAAGPAGARRARADARRCAAHNDVAGDPQSAVARDAVLAGGLRALPVVRPGPRPVPGIDAQQPAVQGLARVSALCRAAAVSAPADRADAAAVRRRAVHPVPVEGAARGLPVRAVARAAAGQPPGQPSSLRERPRHHAGTRIHPRAAAGPAERRAFPAPRRALDQQNLPRWSGALALESQQGPMPSPGLFVDPDGDSGLVRSNPDSPGSTSLPRYDFLSCSRYATKSRRCAKSPTARARVRRWDPDGSSSCCANSTTFARRSGR